MKGEESGRGAAQKDLGQEEALLQGEHTRAKERPAASGQPGGFVTAQVHHPEPIQITTELVGFGQIANDKFAAAVSHHIHPEVLVYRPLVKGNSIFFFDGHITRGVDVEH